MSSDLTVLEEENTLFQLQNVLDSLVSKEFSFNEFVKSSEYDFIQKYVLFILYVH
jgi:hypothetical protein